MEILRYTNLKDLFEKKKNNTKISILMSYF